MFCPVILGIAYNMLTFTKFMKAEYLSNIQNATDKKDIIYLFRFSLGPFYPYEATDNEGTNPADDTRKV